MSYRVLPCLTVSYRVLPCLTVSYRVLPCLTVSHRVSPCAAQVGMFGVVALLLAAGEDTASKVMAFFGPCLSWIAKWLPLFYVASLVTLPLNLSGIAGALL